MLKREITYEDFNGDQVTEVFYFHLSESELIEMNVEHDKGLIDTINRIIKEKDNKVIVGLFKDIILKSYGEKSADGKRFIKSDELRTAFSQTAAYNVLFMELGTNDQAAVTFLKGVLPKNMGVDIDKTTASISPVTSVPDTNVVNP